MTRASFDSGIPDVSALSLRILRHAKVRILDDYVARLVDAEMVKTETQCSSLNWGKDKP